MLYLLLIGIFFLTQQGIKGALNGSVPEPEIMACVPSDEELAQAKKELEGLIQQWRAVFLKAQLNDHRREESAKKKRFSLPVFQTNPFKSTQKDDSAKLMLLQIASEYCKLRRTFPQLPEEEAIEFFIFNCVPNGSIDRFRFNHPYSPSTVTLLDRAWEAKVDWRNYPSYAEVEVDQETGQIKVSYPSGLRERSKSSPPPREKQKSARIVRSVSYPPKPEKFCPKGIDSGYPSQGSIRSWESGGTQFAEV
ncbi:MAG: hypothetical protein EBU90_06295 [Proteobacteria bacterium]|nr:hypothetical protein [Pseudomonadota bacterium]NBP14367.1 hypothetical protein [bacterium]